MNKNDGEILREKGQFWTPDWIAEAMTGYVLSGKGGCLFDPAVGTGAFFRAAKRVANEQGLSVYCAGMEIDPDILPRLRADGLDLDDIASVRIGDFVLQPPHEKFHSIVANPPYIRHQRIDAQTKAELKRMVAHIAGIHLDGKAGLHVYFLIRALSLLEDNGRLAFIMPADVCEGQFASDLWNWIAKNFALDAVITFSHEATPFPDVDVNPIILFIRKANPLQRFKWVKCRRAGPMHLSDWQLADSSIMLTNRTLLSLTARFMKVFPQVYRVNHFGSAIPPMY